MAAPSLSKRRALDLAGVVKAVADPTRLRMLDLIVRQSQPMCVCEITPHFDQNQPTVSHHLKLLLDAGLIETDRRGIWSFYWTTDKGKRTLTALASLL